MDFPGRSHSLAERQPQDRANAMRIARRSRQADAQAGLAATVAIQFGRAMVLRDHQIHAPIPIEVRQRAAPAFAIDFNAAGLARNRFKPSLAIPTQP